MPGTFTSIETGLRGLRTMQTAMDTAGHNIANVNTPGYTRQSVELTASDPYTVVAVGNNIGAAQIGTGVLAKAITQARDSTLDVQVRDEMLSCIQRLETFDEETLLLSANEVPKSALLVARGSIGLFENGKEIASVPPDGFYGVRDSIHQIAPSVSAVARPGTTVAFFDGARLQKLCEASPENIVAVLERLG